MPIDYELLVDDIIKNLKLEEKNELGEDLITCLSNFKGLSRKNQIELLRKFISHLEFYKKIDDEEKNQKKCESEGHKFLKWYESSSFKNYKGNTFSNRIWCRKCFRCGYVDVRFTKPQEVIDREKEQRTNNEIEDLKRELLILRKGR